MSDSGTNEEALAAVLLQWEEAWEKGEDIPAETLCTECPEMIERVQDRVTALKQMSWMTKAANANEGRFTEQDLLLGKTLAGRYCIETMIAEGGFGVHGSRTTWR